MIPSNKVLLFNSTCEKALEPSPESKSQDLRSAKLFLLVYSGWGRVRQPPFGIHLPLIVSVIYS